mmetsp:Transcript_25918/g.80074  ORF Transcript_25918/g.80074 Transcript_25918/m.80074 type:complete len:244 (+) Transcript_25918:501-1232(+)
MMLHGCVVLCYFRRRPRSLAMDSRGHRKRVRLRGIEVARRGRRSGHRQRCRGGRWRRQLTSCRRAMARRADGGYTQADDAADGVAGAGGRFGDERDRRQRTPRDGRARRRGVVGRVFHVETHPRPARGGVGLGRGTSGKRLCSEALRREAGRQGRWLRFHREGNRCGRSFRPHGYVRGAERMARRHRGIRRSMPKSFRALVVWFRRFLVSRHDVVEIAAAMLPGDVALRRRVSLGRFCATHFC